MISPEEMQEAIVDKLKANAILVNALGSVDIREADWHGKDFVYPNVRVRLGEQRPSGDGACRETQGVQAWTVEVYSEDASSLHCSTLTGFVVDALFGKRLVGGTWRTLQVDLVGVLSPFRAPPGLWRADVYFIAGYY